MSDTAKKKTESAVKKGPPIISGAELVAIIEIIGVSLTDVSTAMERNHNYVRQSLENREVVPLEPLRKMMDMVQHDVFWAAYDAVKGGTLGDAASYIPPDEVTDERQLPIFGQEGDSNAV